MSLAVLLLVAAAIVFLIAAWLVVHSQRLIAAGLFLLTLYWIVSSGVLHA